MVADTFWTSDRRTRDAGYHLTTQDMEMISKWFGYLCTKNRKLYTNTSIKTVIKSNHVAQLLSALSLRADKADVFASEEISSLTPVAAALDFVELVIFDTEVLLPEISSLMVAVALLFVIEVFATETVPEDVPRVAPG